VKKIIYIALFLLLADFLACKSIDDKICVVKYVQGGVQCRGPHEEPEEGVRRTLKELKDNNIKVFSHTIKQGVVLTACNYPEYSLEFYLLARKSDVDKLKKMEFYEIDFKNEYCKKCIKSYRWKVF
jgi:glutamine amidotransferase-like uncharacterized protein